MKRKAFYAVMAAAILHIPVTSQAQVLPQDGGPRHVPGEIIIQFNSAVTDGQIADVFARGGLKLIKHVQTQAMNDHGKIGLTRVATALPLPAALNALKNLPGVDFAEPNWVATPDVESNDPSYLNGSLWGVFGDDLPSPIGPALTTNPYGSQAEKAWAAGFIGSHDVFVGIIDSGFQFDHPDLAANVWTNPGEIPGNGIDDDGNGYMDDIHGWNAVDDNGTIYNTVDTSNEGHGTHVAGTVGAVGGNGIGLSGVNWNVTLIAGKFMAGPGSYLDAIQAIDYMTTLKTKKGLNIVALNNSWSGTAFSQALLDAFTRAAQAGILSICSASNYTNNNDSLPRYPTSFNTTVGAGYDAVISVAALDRDGSKASFSNYGQNSVDLGAPGVDTLSTLPGGAYGLKSGTSMATPHVTGAVALYASIYPGASAAEIRNNLLTSGVRPLAALEGITVTGGILNIGTLITASGTSFPGPASPANLLAVVISGGRVDLSWTDQSNNELGFAIERSTDDGLTFTLADTVGANIAGYSDRTVRPATAYRYRIRVYNAGGSSQYAYAPSAVSTPSVTLPVAPSNFTASALPRSGVKLSWTDKSNNEDGFQVERKTGSGGAWQLLANLGANVTSYTDSSTVSRTTYNYRVRASNAAGSSAYSNEATVKTK